jgi:hypothetical protein
LPLFAVLLLGSSCMSPEYPDDFIESSQSASLADGGTPTQPIVSGLLPAHDAGASTDSALPQPGLPEAGGTLGQPSVDAAVANVGRDASAPDAGPREASVSVEAGASADAGEQVAPGAAATSCTITASTDAADTFFYAGQYGCAVWIGNASNKLVKTFFLATKVASRSGVSSFQRAASGMTVDAVAGATLRSAKQHQYSWDLKDAKGAPVTAGKYTLNVETHSSNGDVTVSVPFDTSSGASEKGSPNGGIRSAGIDCR